MYILFMIALQNAVNQITLPYHLKNSSIYINDFLVGKRKLVRQGDLNKKKI